MIGNLGLLSLIMVAILSSAVTLVYGFSMAKQYRTSTAYAVSDTYIRPFTLGSACLSIFSIVLLAVAFYQDDFSILYVAEHSNTQLPVFFKIAAVWAGHEGSLLFWVLTLACWAGVIALQSSLQTDYQIKVLWVMNGLLCAFTWFTLLSSNPFEFNSVLPVEGRDLNPMLQDVGLIFHPPLLYLGYVGFSAVLAFAVAALLTKEIEFEWVNHCRKWSLVAWIFLTAGIVLGSWWAYYELGWGGWWFWDPVENASLLPWLTATALLHCLTVAKEKRQLLKWAFSLAFTTFSLSILGTFIVRSGVLTSVHAFAVDPSKGLILISILCTVFMASFSLLIIRAESFSSINITHFLSRSFLILLAITLLVVAMLVVLFGTFYPMVYELLGLGNISVGAPYFNLFAVPIGLLVLLLIGFSPLVEKLRTKELSVKVILFLLIISTVTGIFLYLSQLQLNQLSQLAGLHWVVQITWVVAAWVFVSHVYALVTAYKETYFMRVISMSLAHMGMAIFAIGAAMNSHHSLELNKKLEPGSAIQFFDWTLKHIETDLYVGSNFTAERAQLELSEGEEAFIIAPERRFYQVRVMNMSEPAMKWFWHGDVYITMGEKINSSAYAFRIQYKSYVRWIWLGALISVFGAIAALFSRNQIAIAGFISRFKYA